MKKLLLLLLFIVFMAQPCLAALDPSIDNVKTWKNAYRFTNKPKDLFLDWCVAVEDAIDGETTGVPSVLFSGLATATGEALTTAGTLFYDSTTSNLKYYTTSWQTIAASTSSTLDEAYSAGQGITVDAGAVTLTTSAASDSVALAVVGGETGNFSPVTVSNASAYPGIAITSTSTGADITGTSATWSISKAGAITCVGVDTTSTITLANDETILNDTNHEIQLGNGTEDISFGFGTADTLTMTTDTGVATINWGDLDAFTGLTDITGDAADFTIKITADAGDEDLIINQAGAVDASIQLLSAGTGSDTIDIEATAGGVSIVAVDDGLFQVTSTTTADDLVIAQVGAQDASVLIQAAGTGADAISAVASAGGITLTATGASAGDMTVTVGDEYSADIEGGWVVDSNEAAANAIELIAGAAAGGITLTSGTGDITLDSGDDIFLAADTSAGDVISIINTQGTNASAVILRAAAGGIDIDATGAEAGDLSMVAGDDMAITATGALTITGTTTAALTSAALTLGSTTTTASTIIQSGTGDLALTSTDDITLTVATTTTDAIVLTNTAGTNITEDSMAIEIRATAGGINIQSDAALDGDTVVLRADGGATADILIHNDAGTGTDCINLLSDEGGITLTSSAGSITLGAVGAETGDIAISAGDNITITSTGATTIANTEVFTVNGTTTLTGAVTCTAGIQMGAISREPTADGTGTGLIATGTSFVTIVDPTQATDWITLPAPVAGTIIWIGCIDDAAGFEVRTSDPATISLNGVTGENKESAVPSTATLLRLVCVSSNDWIGTYFDASGTEAEMVAPDE